VVVDLRRMLTQAGWAPDDEQDHDRTP
jgi:hypothetical protein